MRAIGAKARMEGAGGPARAWRAAAVALMLGVALMLASCGQEGAGNGG